VSAAAPFDLRCGAFGRLIFTGVHSVQYLIGDLAAMDRHSRKLLDRFPAAISLPICGQEGR